MSNMIIPLVSVIIPNYNHAKFLKERIDSVINQTYNNFEIIILDDNSSDNSVEIIRQYKDHKNVTHIAINEKNSGSPFMQWQKGFELAKGELIWIAESDDACQDLLLETLVKEFQKDPDCVVAFCKSIKIDASGNKIGEAGMKCDIHMNGISFFNKYLYRFCFITNASSAIFKKEVLNRIDWEHTSFKGSGDWILWIEISRCGNIAYVNLPFNFFRIHGANTTTLQLQSGMNELEAIEVYQYMNKKGYISYLKELRERIAHIYSIKYGKLCKILTEEKKKELLSGWRTNPIIMIITTVIYFIYRMFGIVIIKR